MTCGYHINREDGLVTINGCTEVRLPEAIQLGEQILRDPNFDPELPHLVDLRGLMVPESTAGADDFNEYIVNTYRPSIDACIAVVVDDSLDRESLAAMYHLACRMERTELFDHYEQALRWLVREAFAPARPAAH